MGDSSNSRPKDRLRGVLAVVLLGATLLSSSCGRGLIGPETPPNFIVVLVDMLRADHLGIYGYEKATSPRIDELGDNGLVFERAYAPSTWTYPSVVSMFTGLYPSSHGATRDWEQGIGGGPRVMTVVSDPSAWLPPRLAELGYDTAFFSTHGYLAAAEESWHEAFQEVRDVREEEDGGKYIDAIFWKAHDWLRQPRDRPFFLYLHSLDVHGPYPTLRLLPEEEDEVMGNLGGVALDWREDVREYWPGPGNGDTTYLYDGHIRFVDAYIGRIFDELVDLGLAGDTYLIVTSDHGEQFGEHGRWGHGQEVYEQTIQVPLIIGSHRDARPGRIPELVNTAGLLPTILDLVGTNVDADVDAPSFAGLIREGATAYRGYVSVSEAVYYNSDRQAVLTDTRWKLVTDPRIQRTQLFDLLSDPRELAPLGPEIVDGEAAQKMEELIRIRDQFNRRAAQRSLSLPQNLSEEEVLRLRALGYIR